MLSRFHGRMFWLGGLLSVVSLICPLSISMADDYFVGGLAPSQSYRDGQGAAPASFPDANNPSQSVRALQRQILNSAAQIHQVTIGNSTDGIRRPVRPPPILTPPSHPVSIPFVSNGDPAYAFQDDEISLLTSFMQILPAEDLTGITEIQSAPYQIGVNNQNSGVFDTLVSGAVTLYITDTTDRSTDPFYPLLPYHLSEAIGENVYSQVLTPAQQQDWTKLTNSVLPPNTIPSPNYYQQEFGEFYSLWTLKSYDLIQNALASPPSSANPSLAQAFFIASLFLGSPSLIPGRRPPPFVGTLVASLESFTRDTQSNLIPPSASLASVMSRSFAGTGFDTILSIGSYIFHVENNNLVSWSSGLSGFTPLNPQGNPPGVPLPATWLSSISAISSNTKGN